MVLWTQRRSPVVKKAPFPLLAPARRSRGPWPGPLLPELCSLATRGPVGQLRPLATVASAGAAAAASAAMVAEQGWAPAVLQRLLVVLLAVPWLRLELPWALAEAP